MPFNSVLLVVLCSCLIICKCQVVNVALNKPVTARYTCGLVGPERYNSLSDARMSMYSDRQKTTCPNSDSNFGPSAMVDGNDNTVWQSTSINRIYEQSVDDVHIKDERNKNLEALIDLDLQQEFIMEQLIVEFGDSPTPQKVAVYKSLDGKTYTEAMYAVKDLEMCESFFDTSYKEVPSTMNDVLCITLSPISGGTMKIDFNLAATPTSVKEWLRVRYLKLKFYDMMFDRQLGKLAFTYNHYTVKELKVLAECPCNGLQTDCQPSPTTGVYECQCGGNSKGRYCQQCQDLFNQFDFEYGKQCQACNCFGHADACFYDQSVEERKLSLDTNLNKNGGGVCLNCKHNTDGFNCEQCVKTYYRPAGRSQSDENACLPCECSMKGSTVNPETLIVDCVMNNNIDRADGKIPGDCFCKGNVQGSKCNQCKQGFYKLSINNPDGCSECECVSAGTVGGSLLCVGDSTGQCTCKPNVEGRTCSICKDGFYGLDQDNPAGCQPCGCDVGGSVNSVCDKQTGQCTCKNLNIDTRTCSSVKSGFYYPGPHSVSAELEDSFVLPEWERSPQLSGFSGKGYVRQKTGDSFETLLDIPTQSKFSGSVVLGVIYRTESAAPASIQLQVTGQNKALDLALPQCSSNWCQVETSLQSPVKLVSGVNVISVKLVSGSVLFDKMVAIFKEYIQIDENIFTASLPTGCDMIKNLVPASDIEAAACKSLIFSLSMYYSDGPLPCQCDVLGSLSTACDPYLGACLCKDGVLGRTCSECAPDHYNLQQNGCTACSCDGLGYICDDTSGQCQCPANTVGIQCDSCLTNHWGWNQQSGCKSCDCHPQGSSSLQCEQATGNCSCSTGVEGIQCDQCQDNFHSLGDVGCTPCNCDVSGSLTQACNKTSGQCDCKANTEGDRCTVCKKGSFNLGGSSSFGCLSCVCMGITTDCTSSNLKLISENRPLSVTDQSGVNVANMELVTESGASPAPVIALTLTPSENQTFSIDANVQGVFYWTVTDTDLDNLLDLYSTKIEATVSHVIVSGETNTNPTALLIDNSGNILTHPTGNIPQNTETLISVTLEESNWLQNSSPVSRETFMKMLSTVKHLLIPASFTAGSSTIRLSSYKYKVASDLGVSNPSVEACQCGAGYSGKSCQKCSARYKRGADKNDFFGTCVPCECNSHATTCDQETGKCVNCLHNTVGDSCELCAVGFYGTATQGLSTDCAPCPCFEPRVINATCTIEGVCSFCAEGYVGALCNQCSPSYFGTPQLQGGTCKPCSCNGNADECDSTTGVCQSCTSNTTGSQCQQCIQGFFGNATEQSCQACECLPTTSVSINCDIVSGQCVCAPGVGGRTCDKCLDDYWGYDSNQFIGCRQCTCVEAGSVSTQCSATTGVCSCKPNTSGDNCDQCDDGYYGLPSTACQACGCDSTGTLPNTECDKVTGKCVCKPGVSGRQCNTCSPFFVDFGDNGCSECGECEKSLGTDIQTLLDLSTENMETALTVLQLQAEDERLNNISETLSNSLGQLGIAGDGAESITDVVSDISKTQQNLLQASQNLFTQFSDLESLVQIDVNKSKDEEQRHRDGRNSSLGLQADILTFESELGVTIQTITQYERTASAYKNREANSGNLDLNFDEQTAAAEAILNEVKNTSSLDATYNSVTQQRDEAKVLIDKSEDLNEQLNSTSLTQSTLELQMRTLTFRVATADSSLSQAQLTKDRADTYIQAADEILDTTEEQNRQLSNSFTSAQTSVRNTQAVYNGNARTVMSADDILAFPEGVTNYQNGQAALQSKLSSIKTMKASTEVKVAEAEAHAGSLEQTATTIQSVSANISSEGTDAEEAINIYETVISDVATAVENVNTANSVIQQVQTETSGTNFQRLENSFNQEDQASEALRTTMQNIDYQPEALQASITAANSRLDAETQAWAQVDAGITSMVSAAQTLNVQLKDNVLGESILQSQETVDAANKTVSEVIETTDIESEVLNQKDLEIRQIQAQVTQINQLDVQVRDRLSSHQTKVQSLQSNVNSANTLTQTISDKSKTVSEKINSLESKLAQVETVLAKLRQPLKFTGGDSVAVKNSKTGQEQTIDDLQLQVKIPAGFTDGVIFFASGQSDQELELGLAGRELFFEFKTVSGSIQKVNSFADVCDDCWLGIRVTRYGGAGHLSVTKLETGEKTSSSAGLSQDVSQVTSLSESFYIGGYPDTGQSTKVANRDFQGCLSSVNYQGEPINLWSESFSSDRSTSCCEGPTIQPPTSPTITTGGSFSGFGFLIIKDESFVLSQMQQMSLQFRTSQVDGNVHIITISTADGQSFFKVWLISGKVRLNIKTNQFSYELSSSQTYNTGQWTQVVVAVQVGSVTLSVNIVESSSDPVDTASTATPSVDFQVLDGLDIILGAPLASVNQNSVYSKDNFAGCMKSFAITTSTVSKTLDLSSPASQNFVDPTGCIQQVRPGLRTTTSSSYIQVSGLTQTLGQVSSIELEISTTQSDGVLLYISSTTGTEFLYLAIFNGNLVVRYSQQTTGALQSFSQQVDDGFKHSLKIDAFTRRISLQVDGEVFEEGSQTLSTSYLAFKSDSTFYLVGVIDGLDLIPVDKSFLGSVFKLSINDVEIPLVQDRISAFKDATLAGVPVPPELPQTEPLVPCVPPATPSLLTRPQGALLQSTSYTTWSTSPPTSPLSTFFKDRFSFAMEFSCYKKNNVLLYYADGNNMYFIIYMLDGLVHATMKTSTGVSSNIALAKTYNDAKRHSLSILRIYDFLALTIQDDYKNNGVSSEDISEIEFPATSQTQVFLGGIGTNNIEESPLPSSFKVTGSNDAFLAGAFFALEIDKQGSNVAFDFSDLAENMFPRVPETVSYGLSLSGTDSFIAADDLTTSADFTIGLQVFTSSESFILMNIQEASSKFVLLDYVNQKIRLHVPASFPGATGVYSVVLDESVRLCDNEKHDIQLQFLTNLAILTVDGVEKPKKIIPASHKIQAFNSAKFYIGGSKDDIPAGVSNGVSQSMKGCVMSVSTQTQVSGQLTSFDPTDFYKDSQGVTYSCPR